MTNDTLAERIKKADWWHDYSDDGNVRQRGEKECAGLQNEIREIAKADPKAGEKLWALVRIAMHGRE